MGNVWRTWTGAVVVVLSAASHQTELRADRGATQRSGSHDGMATLTLAAAGRTSWAKAAGRSRQSGPPSQTLRQPLAAAVTLLGWFGDDVPRFELAAERPPDGTPNAEAWVRFNADGSAVQIIYVAIKSRVYRDALNDYQSLVKLAGILADERWHLRHGLDETGAYDAQLSIMTYLHASSAEVAEVRRSLSWIRQRARNRGR